MGLDGMATERFQSDAIDRLYWRFLNMAALERITTSS